MKKRKAKRIGSLPRKKPDWLEETKASMSAKRKEYLLKLIKRLKELEADAFRPRHGRFDFYGYLEAILKVYWTWDDKKSRQNHREQLGVLATPVIRPRKGRATLHFLILATSQQKLEVKNRWIQAMRFASRNRKAVEQAGLADFVRKHGGISGSAQKAVRNPRANKSAGDEDWNDD